MKNEQSEFSNSKLASFKEYLKRIFDIRSDMVSYDELHDMMEENTIIHGSNMWILIMAIFIASIGLNVNSTAVIIGAMLVSPLMSGILTMGYSLAACDLTMLRKVFTRFGTQVVISLLASTLYFWISPLEVPTSEMIARTSPTMWDVLIALFGGIAGAIGNTRQKKGNVIPGVAIATALMPPLCTTGYGLATLQKKFIIGAFYLFSINTLFIMLSATFVTKLLGVPVHTDGNSKRQKHVKRLIKAITVLTVIPSVLIGGIKVYQSVMEQNFSNYLNNEFSFFDTQVVKSDIDLSDHVVSVSLVGSQISDDMIERLNNKLSQYNLDGYTLRVTQNKTSADDNADIITIAAQEKTIQDLQSELEEKQETIEKLETEASKQVDCKILSENAEKIFTKLSDCSVGLMSDANGDYILLCADAKDPISEEEKQTIKNWLETESGLSNSKIILN